jgi:hypothetical protein
MSVSGSDLRVGDERVEWALAHSVREVVNRPLDSPSRALSQQQLATTKAFRPKHTHWSLVRS